MNSTITALLVFGGTVQVIADLIVIDKAFGISTAVRALVQNAKERRIAAKTLKHAKANFKIWRRGREGQMWSGFTFETLPYAVQRVLGVVPTNELSRIAVNLDGDDLDWAKYHGRK
jgi:hydroxylamine reductase (hybrid-cluster protein)